MRYISRLGLVRPCGFFIFLSSPLCFFWAGALNCFPVEASTLTPHKTASLKFNNHVLKNIGISEHELDTALVLYSNPQGVINSRINLNDKYIGSADIDFGKDNKPCFTAEQLLTFEVKKSIVNGISKGACQPIDKWHGVAWKYEKQNNTLQLHIPDFYLDKESKHLNLQSGGAGAFLNYDVNASKNYGRYGSSETLSSPLRLGVNIYNTLLRADGRFHSSAGRYGRRSDVDYQAWSIEKDFSEQYRVKAGDIGVGNQLFSAGQIRGLTLNNHAQEADTDTTVTVSGSAADYAQLEVWQQGVVVFSQSIPAGYFLFDDVPLYTPYADAEVLIKEANGHIQRFTLSKASFSVGRQMDSRYALFAGTQKNNNEAVVGLEYRFPFSNFMQPYLGLLVDASYTGAGGGIDYSFIPGNLNASSTLSTSHSKRNGDAGVKIGMQLSGQYDTINAWLSASWQHQLYRDLAESQYYADCIAWCEMSKLRNSVSAGFGMPLTKDLSVSFATSKIDYYHTNPSQNFNFSGNWRNSWFSLNSSLTYRYISGGAYADDLSLYINLSVPLLIRDERWDTSHYINTWKKTQRVGSNVSKQITDDLRASIGIDTVNGQSHTQRHYAQAFWRTPYASTGWYYSSDNFSNKSLNLNISGAVASTREHVVFSANKVQDTFAIADTGIKNIVDLHAAGYQIRTNYDGLAVIPSLYEGKANKIELLGKSIPEDTWVKNTRKEVAVKRGSVVKVAFDTNEEERIYLIRITSPDNFRFNGSALLLKENGQVVGKSIDENIFMVKKENLLSLEKDPIDIEFNSRIWCRLQNKKLNLNLTKSIMEVEAVCEK